MDIPFIGEKGGDKNRSNFIWSVLNQYFDCSLLLVKTWHNLTEPFPDAKTMDFQLVAEKNHKLMPEAIFNYRPNQLSKFRKILIDNKFDYVFFRFTSHAQLMSEVAKCSPTTKIIVDVDMLFSRIAELSWEKNPTIDNRYYYLERLKLRKFESKLFRKPYLFLFSNNVERDSVIEKYANDLPKDNYLILPNTVNETEIPTKVDDRRRILFFGTLNSVANTDSIVNLSENIYPHLHDYLVENDLVIDIVGKGPLKEMEPYYKDRMNLVGPVEDIKQVISDAELIVLPIRIASGTRTRILEAGILGKPIVTTTIGAEGFEFSEDEISIIDDPKQNAERIIHLLNNPEEARQMGENLKKRCMDDYTWDSVGRKLNQMITATKANKVSKNYNIAIVTNRFYPEVGGAETNIYFQARELVLRGHDVTVFCPKRIERPHKEIYDGIKVVRMPDYLDKEKKYPNIKTNTLCPEVFFGILFGKFDVVMMFPAFSYNNLMAFKAAKLSGKPTVLCSFDYLDYATIIKEKGFIPKDALDKVKPKIHQRLFMKYMDFIFAISNKEIELYRRFNDNVGYSPVPILLKEYDVDVENPRSKYDIGDEFVFLSLGRISNIKGQDLALQAFVNVATKIPEAKLVFVGRSDYEPEFIAKMKALIFENALEERVIFTGMVEREEVLGWLKYSDIHVIPVRFMNSGAVVVESWISGTPVLQSDVVDPNLVIEGSNGYLFPSEDIDTLGEKMILAVKNRDKLDEMAKKGEKLVREKYTYEYLCSLYESTFSAIEKK